MLLDLDCQHSRGFEPGAGGVSRSRFCLAVFSAGAASQEQKREVASKDAAVACRARALARHVLNKYLFFNFNQVCVCIRLSALLQLLRKSPRIFCLADADFQAVNNWQAVSGIQGR